MQVPVDYCCLMATFFDSTETIGPLPDAASFWAKAKDVSDDVHARIATGDVLELTKLSSHVSHTFFSLGYLMVIVDFLS